MASEGRWYTFFEPNQLPFKLSSSWWGCRIGVAFAGILPACHHARFGVTQYTYTLSTSHGFVQLIGYMSVRCHVDKEHKQSQTIDLLFICERNHIFCVSTWSYCGNWKPEETSGKEAGVYSGGQVSAIAPVLSPLSFPLVSAVNNGLSSVALRCNGFFPFRGSDDKDCHEWHKSC